MAKDGNGTIRWIAYGLFALIIVVLGAHLSDGGEIRAMALEGAKANARQDATISAISETNKRIEAKVDRILSLILRRKP